MLEPLVNASFSPPRGWRAAHMQTLRSRLSPPSAPSDALASTRLLRIPMDDGTGDELGVALHTPLPQPAPRPAPQMVVLVHGLGGSAESPYMLATAAQLLRGGIAVARLDLRGAGHAGTTSTQMYHAGRTADVRTVLAAVADEPEADPRRDGPTLGLMGFSLGGNVSLKLLGEPLGRLPVVAGMSVSAPLDLAVGGEYLRRVAFGAYESAMLRGLKADVARFAGPLGDDVLAQVMSARTLEEFDNAFTARQNGWRDAAEYYAVNSSAQYLPHITVPTLVLHALDDPVVPPGPYRSIDWSGLERSGPVRRAITDYGGHVGFHQAGGRPPWYAEQAVEFFTSLGQARASTEPSSSPSAGH